MTINSQTLQGHWNEIRGKLHERWGQLTDDELNQAQGNVEQLVGAIQRKTGESRERIQSFLEELTANGHSAGQGAMGAAQESVQAAAARAQEMAQQAREQAELAAEQALAQLRANYESSQELVRRHPLESIATCFGIGVVTGLMVGLLVRR